MQSWVGKHVQYCVCSFAGKFYACLPGYPIIVTDVLEANGRNTCSDSFLLHFNALWPVILSQYIKISHWDSHGREQREARLMTLPFRVTFRINCIEFLSSTPILHCHQVSSPTRVWCGVETPILPRGNLWHILCLTDLIIGFMLFFLVVCHSRRLFFCLWQQYVLC